MDPATSIPSVDCETNYPIPHSLTACGEVNQTNALHASEGWRGLKNIQTRAGIIGDAHRDLPDDQQPHNQRIQQFALAHL